jgi:hypothetical protein
MSRQSWIYPADGSPPYEKGTYHAPKTERGFATIMPDLPDFVSPLDGRAYSGRAGLREHCVRHNVVPYSDVKGLPPLNYNSDMRSPEQKRESAEQRKQLIINQVNKHYR